MSTTLDADRTAAGLIFTGLAQSVEQMRLLSKYDSRMKMHRTKYKELLLAYQNLHPQVTKFNNEKLTWYYNALEKYFKVMDSQLTHYQTDPLQSRFKASWELETVRNTVFVVDSISSYIEFQVNELKIRIRHLEHSTANQ